MINQKTIEQEELLYSKLTGQTKRDYFVDFFVSTLCFALKDRRKALGMTQSDVAKLMGVKQSYVSKMENFEKTPTVETVARYLFALNLSFSEVQNLVEESVKSDNPRLCLGTTKKKSESAHGFSKKYASAYAGNALLSCA